MTEDELHDGEEKMQKLTDKYVKEIDAMVAKKSKEAGGSINTSFETTVSTRAAVPAGVRIRRAGLWFDMRNHNPAEENKSRTCPDFL